MHVTVAFMLYVMYYVITWSELKAQKQKLRSTCESNNFDQLCRWCHVIIDDVIIDDVIALTFWQGCSASIF